MAAAVAALLAPAESGGAAVAPGQDHACIVGTPPREIDWSLLRNPVLSFPTAGVKDQALQWSGGAWHMLYSDMVATATAPHVRFSVAVSSSPDLAALDASADHRCQRRIGPTSSAHPPVRSS